jgi:hypothetical protein
MPGPMSAPNGKYSLTLKQRDPGKIVTGKTAKKRGKSKNREHLTRAERERLEQN